MKSKKIKITTKGLYEEQRKKCKKDFLQNVVNSFGIHGVFKFVI